jgi:Nucleotide modification associated domain 3
MHLDPDFSHLTYGDQGQRGVQISSKLQPGDLLVFYAALCHIIPQPRLIYALIGLYVIDKIVPAVSIPPSRWNENTHTRRRLSSTAADIGVRARPSVSGRLERCVPIGSFRPSVCKPFGRPCYRVDLNILSAWGGLSGSDGYVQRSALLPEFLNAPQFYHWFLAKGVLLVRRNN